MKRERINILFGGMAGFMSVALVQLLTMNELDVPLTISTYCFAFALPLSVFYLQSSQDHLKAKGTEVPKLYEGFAIAAILVGFAGLTSLFFHFGIIQAMVFAIISYSSVGIYNDLHENQKRYFQPIKKKLKSNAAKK